uniref:ER membrane protein complex subunit 10 n=1 Tax=Hirondellea gigas TaxID=1518452 RepID=A0A6A7FWN6_9CRUS
MLKYLFVVGLFNVVFSQQMTFQDDPMERQLIIVVEDNLGDSSGDGEAWSERSLITIRNVKLGQTQVTHTRPWNQQLTKKLKELAQANGFYRLRLHSRNGKEPSYVHTFTDSCMLYSGKLSEIISLLIDASPSLGGFTQSLIGASVVVPGAQQCWCSTHSRVDEDDDGGSCDAVVQTSQLAHNTSVVVQSPATPTAPDTATYIQKVEAAITKEKNDPKDNRSFFAKYWMYFIPLVLLYVMSTAGGQEGGR